jgi:serine protease Do
MGLGAVLCFTALIGWGVYQGYTGTLKAAAAVSASASAATGRSTVKLPSAQRHVPHHAVSLLRGCTDADLGALTGGIDGAIEIGAPLYNAGNFAGCYHMYEGTASDLERKIGASCPGAARALAAGRTHAASMTSASDQAWAMRDAFDGLIDVVARSSAESQ